MRLLTLAGFFYHRMEDRLLEKQRRGWKGWGRVPEKRLKERLLDNLDRGDYVDVANLALIMWAQEFKKRQCGKVNEKGLWRGLDGLPLKYRFCPNCHGKVRVARSAESRPYYVTCDQCGVDGANSYTPAGAIEAWRHLAYVNRRINDGSKRGVKKAAIFPN